MKNIQNADLYIQFDSITRRLRKSGADLSKIKIAMEPGKTSSYITKRMMKELLTYREYDGD